MGTGLQVLNDSGSIQIDENYNNLFLVRKATYTLSSGNVTTSQQLLDLTFRYTPLDPSNIVAIAPVNPQGQVCSVFTLQNGQYAIRAGGDWTVYEFGKITQVVGSYGLHVIRADGSVAFDSNQKPMRVLQQIKDTYSTYSNQYGTSYAVPAGRKVAAVFSNQHVQRFIEVRTAPTSRTFATFTAYTSMRFNSDSVATEWGKVDVTERTLTSNSTWEPVDDTFRLFGAFFVIDVTNY